ncbi:MAG: C-GCAxxG-C-C family (seleno)protein [Promethearchaeota archaeon]
MKKKQDILEGTMNYWKRKANCARSTACGILEYYGKNSLSDPFYKGMLPMGGGLGEGLVCGAVIGSLVATSLVLVESGLNDEMTSKQIKKWKQEFIQKFESLNCFDLINEFRNAEGKVDLKMPGRREKCTEIVASAVTIAKQVIDFPTEQ